MSPVVENPHREQKDSSRMWLYIDPNQPESKEVLQYMMDGGWMPETDVIDVTDIADSYDIATPCLAGAVGPHYSLASIRCFLECSK